MCFFLPPQVFMLISLAWESTELTIIILEEESKQLTFENFMNYMTMGLHN
jgi:hypothetical protein